MNKVFLRRDTCLRAKGNIARHVLWIWQPQPNINCTVLNLKVVGPDSLLSGTAASAALYVVRNGMSEEQRELSDKIKDFYQKNAQLLKHMIFCRSLDFR